jgi:hypothetical protein
MQPKVRLHKTLVDYKGRLLGPERVGKMTTEYFAQQLELLYPKPTEEQELAAYVAARPPAKEPDIIDEEPEEGNELRDLKERLKRQRAKESDEFWENIDKEEEYEEPIDFILKLNIINPFTKKPL